MVQVRGIKGQVYLKFNDPQQLEDATKGTFQWWIINTRLSVKSMGMRPMCAPRITCGYFKTCVVRMASLIYFPKRCFPTNTAETLPGVRFALFSPTTYPITRTRPLRDAQHWYLWLVKCQNIVVEIGQGTCFITSHIILEERPRRKRITRHPGRT
jgi:hypothetical protein